MTDRWIYAEEGERCGPETLEGLLVLFSRNPHWEQTLVWRDGFETWKRAEDVVDISARIRMPPPLPQEVLHPSAISPPSIPDGPVEFVKAKPKKNLAALRTTAASKKWLMIIAGSAFGLFVGWAWANFYLPTTATYIAAYGPPEVQRCDKALAAADPRSDYKRFLTEECNKVRMSLGLGLIK